MATTNIAADIQNITGVTTANAQFLISAQKFVAASVPKNLLKWAATATVPGNHGGNTSDGVKITMPIGTDSILDVSRNGFSGTEVPYNMKGFIANTASLYLATNTYPKYYLDDANPGEGVRIIVKPIPTDSETAIALYVDSSKIDDDCDLRNAVVFHACSSEFTKLAAFTTFPSLKWSFPSVPVTPASPSFSAPTISSITVTDTTVGNMPTVSSVTISNMGAPPAYTSPVIGGDATELTSLDDLDTENTIDVHADQPEWDQWFATAGHLIEGEEDVELANAQLQKISAYAQVYSAAMQNQLNEFNEASAEYQAKLQEAVQQLQADSQKVQQQAQLEAQKVSEQAKISAQTKQLQSQLDAQDAQQEANLKLQKEFQEYTSDVQRFSADVTAYQSDVNKIITGNQAQVQEWSAKNSQFKSYVEESNRYYQWSQLEVQTFIQNNSKMIKATLATQLESQQRSGAR